MQAPRAKTVILSNGVFPCHALPLAALAAARHIVCCDGAVAKLEAAGMQPDWIVGDLDSLAPDARERYAKRLVYVREQATNDLAKAFNFCIANEWRDIVIVGATGLREDHTLGNIAWLGDFAMMLQESAHQARSRKPRTPVGRVVMLTDSGIFTPITSSTQFRSHSGQAVSLFALEPGVAVYTEGLKYSLEGVPFTRWWQATLNEACGETFKVLFEKGPLLVFQGY